VKFRYFVFPILFAGVVGSLLVYIAFQHNPQGETLDQVTGAINYRYVLALFGSSFAIALAIAVAVEALVYLLIKAVSKARRFVK
jgi:hypothetical protein